MGDKTSIEWTEATWNPVTGCTEVSAGCDHCYARKLARGRLAARYLKRHSVSPGRQEDPFAIRLWPERLDEPRRWREPRMVFVCSMSDLFHREVPVEYVRRVFAAMLKADHHTYQVLTKRPARALRFLRSLWAAGIVGPKTRDTLPPHIWIGTSIENREQAFRFEQLNNVPTAMRFVSCEPLLGPLHLPSRGMYGLDWLIVGGESGRGARYMDPVWARLLLEQCRELGIPFFMKQMGSAWARANSASDPKGGDPSEWPEDLRVREYPNG